MPSSEPFFRDRRDAGRQLAKKLSPFARQIDVLVLALPRGGVPVGYEVAQALGVPLDVFVVRKLGAPGQEELAMGAIASGGVRILNAEVVDGLGVSPGEIERATLVEKKELERRERLYRGDRPPLDVHGRTVIIVDDGLATGSTMRAAVHALRAQNPKAVVVAVPVAAADTCKQFREEFGEMVCLHAIDPFYAVGAWYEDFGQTSDEQVRQCLERAHRDRG